MLRVPDDLHRRLAARAAREGRSVNALATEVLDSAAEADIGGRHAEVRAKAAALGMLVPVDAAPADPAAVERGKEELARLAPEIVRILDEDRSTGL